MENLEKMNYQIDEDEDIILQETETFRVDDDNKAEWALKKIKKIRDERDRLVNICKQQIAFYEDKITGYTNTANNDEQYFIMQLVAYFETVPHTSTKTQEKYTLPSGSLIKKYKAGGFEKTDALLEELQRLNMTDFIKTTPAVKWAELKDTLQVVEGKPVCVTPDGEIITLESVVIGETSAKFEVKL